jgi:ABC-type glycerol-3-phosphate transport system substrate-binding protein
LLGAFNPDLDEEISMKKIIVFTALLVLLSGMLPACSPASVQQPKTVTVWWWGEGDTPGSKAWLEETASAYEKDHSGITIDLVEQTTDQLYPAWEAAITAKEGPDIQFLWTGIWALQYVWEGDVADLKDLIPESEINHWVATEGISYQDRPWLVPWYRISIVMLYNKDILREANLNPDQPPKTWEEFLAACEAVKGTGKIPFEQGGLKDAWGAAWLFSTFAPAAHDDIGDFVMAATEPGTFTQPQNKDWLDKLSQLNASGYSDPQTMSLDFFQGREAFHQGNAAFGLATNGQAIQWINDMGGEEHVGIMRFPAFGTGAMAGGLNVQTHSFAIPEFAKNKEEAADLLMFMHTPERLTRWYELTSNFPADDRFDSSVLKTQTEKDLFQYMTDDSIPWAEIYIPVQVDEEGVYSAVQMIYSGGTPDQAAQTIEDAAAKWRSVDPSGVKSFTEWGSEFTK